MKIGLLSTIDTNIGDDFIRCGITNVIEGLCGEGAVNYVVINKHEPESIRTKWQHRLKRSLDRLPKISRSQVLARRHFPRFSWSRFDPCDLLIQCGTPVLWNGCRYSEWAEPIWRDVLQSLSRLGKPVLNIGGGTCYAWEQIPETLEGDEDEAFARLMLQTCRLSTARDQLAKKLFGTLGHNIEVICCPAILAGQGHVTPTASTRKVLFNYMEGGGHFDFDQAIDKLQWEKTMRDVVRSLHVEGWQPTFLAHDMKEYELARRIWPEFHCERPTTLRAYFEFIRDAAFGVFNRMHASIAAAGLGIPSVAIGTDTRNMMVAEAGLPVFYVKEATTHIITNTTQRIAVALESHNRRLLRLREETHQQYRSLLAPYVPPGDVTA
jgi:polysaccharide pyruvyl transferase WcaK-like protein